ncbi:Uncharacterised protein [Serratia marcescens]|nr:Uncharacterised protein [Serratia marcescens]
MILAKLRKLVELNLFMRLLLSYLFSYNTCCSGMSLTDMMT